MRDACAAATRQLGDRDPSPSLPGLRDAVGPDALGAQDHAQLALACGLELALTFLPALIDALVLEFSHGYSSLAVSYPDRSSTSILASSSGTMLFSIASCFAENCPCRPGWSEAWFIVCIPRVVLAGLHRRVDLVDLVLADQIADRHVGNQDLAAP